MKKSCVLFAVWNEFLDIIKTNAGFKNLRSLLSDWLVARMENTRHSEFLWRSQKNSPIIHLWKYRGRGCIAPTHRRPRHEMWVSDQGHVPAALCPGERTPGTHCTGGWVGPRAGLNIEARGKISYPCRGSNFDCPVVQSVARHYTD
jgi:hypothetical protein